MTIKVFVSQPRDSYAESKLPELVARLTLLTDGINKFVNFKFVGGCPLMTETDYGCFANNISIIRDCNFVVLANGSDNDKRCRLEKEIATWLNIPSCGEDEFPQFVRGYIGKLFSVEIVTDSRKKASTALDRLADLQESQCDLSPGDLVVGTCADLIKELTKSQRGKSNEKDIVAEACDVITSVSVLLRTMHVPEEHIYDQIVYRCDSTVERLKQKS